MAQRPWNPLLEHIRSLAARGDSSTCDAELLHQFVTQCDESAFESLLRRHGPMVLRVARRSAGNDADAEDVFQATFLLLARRAAAIRKRESVASWLHSVAHRLALSARSKRIRRQQREREAAAARPIISPPESVWSQWEEALHEVLAQLPAKYRTPLVYCYLEGRTQEEVARQLGKPLGTVRSWLARGRKMLRKRLLHRGVSLTTEGASAALLASACATAEAVPPMLSVATIQAVHLFATGGNAMTMISPAITTLVREGMTAMLIAKLKSVTAWVLVLALLVAGSGWAAHRTFSAKAPEVNEIAEKASSKQAAPEARPRIDAFGDPLPPGAIARLGCMRLRHGGTVLSLAFSPDGKVLASGGDFGLIRLWHPLTGKEIRRLNGNNGYLYGLAFSRNGKLLASCGSTQRSPMDCILIWDVSTGKSLFHLSHSSKKNGNQGATSVAFSPDGKVLASGGTGGSIYLWNIETRNVLHYFHAPNGTDIVAFSHDGAIFFSASHFEGIIRRWSVATGKELQPLAGQKKGTRSIAIDRKGRFLASSGDDGFCRVWHLASGKEHFRISGGKSGIAYPTFSPDGKIIAGVIGKQVHFWDAASGKESHQIKSEDWPIALNFSPDGSILAWGNGNGIHLVDPQTGKQRFPHEGHKGGIGRVAFSSDGTKVLTSGSDNTTCVWEARTGREFSRHRGYAHVFSPDGKMAVSSAEDGKSIRLWDPITGKEILRLPGKAPSTLVIFAHHTFSADGKHFASYGGHGTPIRVWETATRKELYRVPVQSDAVRGTSVVGDGAMGRELRQIPAQGLLGALALSPNGKYLAVLEYPGLGKPITIWDIGSGRETKFLPRKNSSANALAFAPEGAILAVAESSGVQFRDIHTGEDRGQIRVPLTYVGQLAFSPDGKSLATVGGFEGSVYLWEMATGKNRVRFVGHAGRLRTLAFSLDGKLLVTGGDDGTPLVWDVMDVAPIRQARQAKLTAEALADCETALSSEDAEKAWRAMRTLVAASEQTVPFLRERLAAQVAAAEKTARWIAELDDDAFAVRERASQELAALGKTAIPALRKAQENPPSAEVARRVKDLLDKLGRPGLSSAELASLRSIEVLEHLGTSEARQLLAKLAKGAADTRLTQEAKSSLRRLAKRANKP